MSTIQSYFNRRSPLPRSSHPISIRLAGRLFSDENMAVMRQAAADCAALGVTEIARTVCEWLDWKGPNGGLENHECRLLLERLRDDGCLTLPPLCPFGKKRSPCAGPHNHQRRPAADRLDERRSRAAHGAPCPGLCRPAVPPAHPALSLARPPRSSRRQPALASGPRQTDCTLLSFFRARWTFSRMSEAVAVQMNGLGF